MVKYRIKNAIVAGMILLMISELSAIGTGIALHLSFSRLLVVSLIMITAGLIGGIVSLLYVKKIR
jgi:hypothetical protein